MFRVCFQGAEPFGHECATLEQAYAFVRATAGRFDVLQGEAFWLCCRVGDGGDAVVARIYRYTEVAPQSALSEAPAATEAQAQSHMALRAPSVPNEKFGTNEAVASSNEK